MTTRKCPRCGLPLRVNSTAKRFECVVDGCDYAEPLPADVEARLAGHPRLFE